MFTRTFWNRTLEHVVRGMAINASLVLGTNSLNLFEVRWPTVVGMTLGAGLLSALASIASAPLGHDDDSPTVT